MQTFNVKRSKRSEMYYALFEGARKLVEFSVTSLADCLEKHGMSLDIENVAVTWRDGMQTVERFKIVCRERERVYTDFIGVERTHRLCMLMRTQGAALGLSIPVDVRALYDMEGALVKSIEMPADIFLPIMTDLKEEERRDDMMAEGLICCDIDDALDDDEEDYLSNGLPTHQDYLREVIDNSMRAADWATTMPARQLEQIWHDDLEYDEDEDEDLPVPPDLEEDFF